MLELSRSVYVSLAHRYWNHDWDREANLAAYGAQASPEGVGANLRVELSCDDERDLQLGVTRLKELVDHRALFEDFGDFAHRASTLERVTLFLAARVGVTSWRTLAVHEDERLSCVARPDGRLTLRERVFNLVVECTGVPDAHSGVIVARGVVARAVRAVAPRFAADTHASPNAWARGLFDALGEHLPGLSALEVALNPHEVVRVGHPTKGEFHA